MSIHPYDDGNGRTFRLLMNHIRAYYNLLLAIVRSENKAAYIQTLIDTREKNDIQIFRRFMAGEYSALLHHEIEKFKQLENHLQYLGLC